jgi:hypothetical protein
MTRFNLHKPGSRGGRVIAPSPANFANGSQIIEPMEKTYSCSGTGQYPKPAEERWGFEVSRDGGSFGARSSDMFAHVLRLMLKIWLILDLNQNFYSL